MADYSLTFLNKTSLDWTFTVFVTIPDTDGALSVAWKVVPVARVNGRGDTSWRDVPCVCIGETGSDVFQQSIQYEAATGQAWRAFIKNGIANLEHAGGSLTPGNIEIANYAGKPMNLALGFDGQAAVYAPDVPSNLFLEFIPKPAYWVMIASGIAIGKVITSGSYSGAARAPRGLSLSPLPLKFPSGVTAAQVTASDPNGATRLDIQY